MPTASYYRRAYANARRSRKRTRRGNYYRRGRRTLKTRVVQILNRKTETKYYDIGAENLQLYHNLGQGVSGLPPTSVSSLPLFFNPWINIQQGTGRFNRVGDKITPRGMRLKIYLANKIDRPHTQIRVIVSVLPKVVSGSLVTSLFDPFQIPNSGVLGNTMLYPPDTDKGVKFLYDRIHKVDNMGWFSTPNNGKECTKYLKLWIKRKRSRDIVFDTTSSTIVNKPLAIYIIPYEQYSTLTTDNIASCAVYMRMYYKDA